MANSNFVVHNGLTVGPTTIDAASGNITIPVGKHITIGNVMLRDNGGGRLAIRDITDNSDAIVDATLDSGSQTLGNIQIGTNHIESINANGPISLRPNGAGNIAFAANTIMLGKGGAFTLISTGEQTAADLGINYTPSNIIVQTTGALSSGNVRVSMTTPSTSTATGALQVLGGVGVRGAVYVNSQDNVLAIGNGGTNGVGNIGATGATFNTIFAKATTAQYADLAEKYLADAEYSPGTVVHFGGEQEVSICDVDMCTRVAGVVSTQPGYIMNEGLSGEHVVVLALTGRVPTKVRGPISKGDLVVSAGEGYARAETLPQVGTVIGKALEDFDGDSGVIEVVVGKH
jgi:hypothetical protein